VGVSGLGAVEQGGMPLGGAAAVSSNSLRLSSSRILTPTLRQSSSARSRASQSDFSQRRIRSSARLAGQPSKGGHMLVEAAQQRLRVGLSPERYERE
jgi:hypothetical protein